MLFFYPALKKMKKVLTLGPIFGPWVLFLFFQQPEFVIVFNGEHPHMVRFGGWGGARGPPLAPGLHIFGIL